jgi:hypothetical protein
MSADVTIDFISARMAAKRAAGRGLTLVHDAGHPQANVGLHGFPPVEAPLIDQDGHRVLIRGRLYRTLMTLSNATRVAEALQTLAELGCELPEPPAGPEAA